jgi:hypothetical protein
MASEAGEWLGGAICLLFLGTAKKPRGGSNGSCTNTLMFGTRIITLLVGATSQHIIARTFASPDDPDTGGKKRRMSFDMPSMHPIYIQRDIGSQRRKSGLGLGMLACTYTGLSESHKAKILIPIVRRSRGILSSRFIEYPERPLRRLHPCTVSHTIPIEIFVFI